MELDWCIYDSDVYKVTEFVNGQSGNVVTNRIEKNIEHKNLELNQDIILKSLLLSLLISNKKSASGSKILSLFQVEPFPFQYNSILKSIDVKEHVSQNLKKNGIVVDINKVPEFFATNFNILEDSGWNLLNLLRISLKSFSKISERELADIIDGMFKGFGATEARIFLQFLGITKFEIPLTPAVTDWLNNFGFPIKVTHTALQDRNFYHFISDGVQLLCEKANIYPCVLEAAIQSSKQNKGVGAYIDY